MSDDAVRAWMKANRNVDPWWRPPVIHVADQMFDWLTQYATDHADDLGCDLTLQNDGLYLRRVRVMPQPPTGDLPEDDSPAIVRTGIWSERQGRFFDSVAEAIAAGSADTPAVVPAKEG